MPCPATALRASTALLLAALTLTSPGAPALAQSNVLKVVPNSDLRLIDPVQTVTLITRMHGELVYESLFAWDSKFESKPMMVESYTVSPDGLSYRFTLRPGQGEAVAEPIRSEEHTSELQSPDHLVCRLLLEKKKTNQTRYGL